MPKLVVVGAMMVVLSVAQAGAQTIAELSQQVRDTEVAFAKTMVDRNHAAFVSFVAAEAVFFGGANAVRRGQAAVAEAWKPFFDGPQAPFSWAPERVEVLDSGDLALSTGPVVDAGGRGIGTFSSVWRRGPDGAWRIIFDKGCPLCAGAPAVAGQEGVAKH